MTKLVEPSQPAGKLDAQTVEQHFLAGIGLGDTPQPDRLVGFSVLVDCGYVRRIMRKHIELFSGVVPMFIRCTVDSEVLTEFSPYLENGTFGIFETGSCLAPFGRKAEGQQEWIYRYCRSGKTLGYAESFVNACGCRNVKEELLFAPPQAFYWRVLCDLHKGVSYIACCGDDLNMAVTAATFAPLGDGAQIVIQNSAAPVCLHMLAIERK